MSLRTSPLPELSPFFLALKRGIESNFPQTKFWSKAIPFSLISMTHKSLENLPYGFLAKKLELNDLNHFIFSRFSYLEGCLIATVCGVYHVAFSIFSSIMSFSCLQKSSYLNDLAYQQVPQIFGCAEALLTGIAGVAYIPLGGLSDGGILYQHYLLFRSKFLKDLRQNPHIIEHIKTGYKDYNKYIHNLLLLTQENIDLIKIDEDVKGIVSFEDFLNLINQLINPNSQKLNTSSLEDTKKITHLNVQSKLWSSISTIKQPIHFVLSIINQFRNLKPQKVNSSSLENAPKPDEIMDFFPFILAVKQSIEAHFPRSSQDIYIAVYSSALFALSYKTLENVPYVFFAKELKINDLNHFIFSRFSYVESSLISAACLVYQIAMTFFAMSLSLICIRKNLYFNYTLKKHLTLTGYSLISFVISLIGIVNMQWSSKFNFIFIFYLSFRVIKQEMEEEIEKNSPLLSKIQSGYKKHKKLFHHFLKFLIVDLRKDQNHWEKVIEPNLIIFEKKFEILENSEDFFHLMDEILKSELPEYKKLYHQFFNFLKYSIVNVRKDENFWNTTVKPQLKIFEEQFKQVKDPKEFFQLIDEISKTVRIKHGVAFKNLSS